MVPCGSIWSRLEAIGVAAAGGNGTHGYRRHAIHPFTVLLIDPMPVHCCAFFWIGNRIVDRHMNGVSPIRFDQGLAQFVSDALPRGGVTHSWILSIDQEGIFGVAIRSDGAPGDGEVICPHHSGVWAI